MPPSILSLSLILVVIASASTLECYYCRINYCNHDYCQQSNGLMDTSGVAMNVEAWKKLPDCPKDEDRKSKEPKYIVTCPKKALACGLSVFNITATASKQIVPGGGSNVTFPVIGGRPDSKYSTVIAYGCVMPKYKSCSPGYALEYKVPSAGSGQGSVTDIIVTNTEAACCHCQENRCNDIDGTFKCDASVPQSDTANGGDTGSGSGAEMPVVYKLALVLSIICVFFK